MCREHEETRIVTCSAMHECLSVGSIEQLSAYRPGQCDDIVVRREWRLRVRISDEAAASHCIGPEATSSPPGTSSSERFSHHHRLPKDQPKKKAELARFLGGISLESR